MFEALSSFDAADRPGEAGELAGGGDGDDRASLGPGFQPRPGAVQALLGAPGDGDRFGGLAVLAVAQRLGDPWPWAVVSGGLSARDTVAVAFPLRLSTHNNLANAYQAAGRTGNAIAIFEPLLADRERILGAEHPDTLITRHNLASAYQAAKRTDAAEHVQQRSAPGRS